MHGQFVWYELTTPDVDAAKRFYSRVTGWGTQRFDDDYDMWTSGGRPIGGLMHLGDEMRQQGVPPNWLPYVESDDVDATAAKAASLGGRVVYGPEDIPGGGGRFVVLQDPQGAMFGALKPGTPGGAWDGTPVVGRFSWHELMTTDYVKAFEFYRDLFGWEKTGEMDMGGGQNYFMYGKGDTPYGAMFNRFGDMASMNPFWLVYIHVKDVGTAVTAATKAGAMVHRPQMDIPGGSIAILGDPQGAGFALHHVSAPAAAAKPSATKSAATTAKKTAKVAKKAVKKAVKAVKKAAKKAATRVKSVAKKAAKSPPRAKSKAKAKKQARPAARKPNAKKATRATAKRGKKAARKR
jgi:predicted enzyme related to lactoylglutathione lyase